MNPTLIETVVAWEAFDSRGNPTVACTVVLSGGAEGTATVPSGASTGHREVHEARDGGQRYGGKGVLRAIEAIRREIAPKVKGFDAMLQRALDTLLTELDGTADLDRLGGNALLGVSLAACIAAAHASRTPLYQQIAGDRKPTLPLPMVNILSGGMHAADSIDIQDVLVIPLGAPTFADAVEWAWRVRRAAAEVATEAGFNVGLVADEGGLGLPLGSNRAAFDLVVESIERAGFQPLDDVALAVDVAANQLRSGAGYQLHSEGRRFSPADFVDEIVGWCDDYPIVSIEDPLAEDDLEGWTEFSRRQRNRIQVVGDDLFVTSAERLRRMAPKGIANAVLVKANQVGTLSGALEATECAQSLGYAAITSGRSGDTEDSWLADVAVGSASGQIKVGSFARSERTAKWNRLLRISMDLEQDAFAGRRALAPILRGKE